MTEKEAQDLTIRFKKAKQGFWYDRVQSSITRVRQRVQEGSSEEGAPHRPLLPRHTGHFRWWARERTGRGRSGGAMFPILSGHTRVSHKWAC